MQMPFWPGLGGSLSMEKGGPCHLEACLVWMEHIVIVSSERDDLSVHTQVCLEQKTPACHQACLLSVRTVCIGRCCDCLHVVTVESSPVSTVNLFTV